MGRALLILSDRERRSRAHAWIDHAPLGTRVTFQAAKRSLPQNSLLWALLSDVATQKEHCGRKYSAEDWKCLFMHALGQEMRFLPALDGKTFVPIGHRSSDLSKQEMTDLIENIIAWGEANGVVFHDHARAA